MGWLLWRELTIMTRIRALWMAMAVQVMVLTSLIVVWGDGVPPLGGTFFEQFAAIHVAFLVAVLPWIAARAGRGNARDIALVAAMTARSPRTVVAARCIAVFIVLLATLASAAPLLTIALRITNASIVDGSGFITLAFGLCMFVATVVTAAIVAGASRPAAWVLGFLATTVMMLALPDDVAVFALAGTAAAMAVWGTNYADVNLAYLGEGPAA